MDNIFAQCQEGQLQSQTNDAVHYGHDYVDVSWSLVSFSAKYNKLSWKKCFHYFSLNVKRSAGQMSGRVCEIILTVNCFNQNVVWWEFLKHKK